MNNARCRMHGGRSCGAPGNVNALKHGRKSLHALAERRYASSLLRHGRAILKLARAASRGSPPIGSCVLNPDSRLLPPDSCVLTLDSRFLSPAYRPYTEYMQLPRELPCILGACEDVSLKFRPALDCCGRRIDPNGGNPHGAALASFASGP
jgi:hypothetical protein